MLNHKNSDKLLNCNLLICIKLNEEHRRMENKEKHLGSVRRDESPKSRKRDEEKEPFSWKKEILSWIHGTIG